MEECPCLVGVCGRVGGDGKELYRDAGRVVTVLGGLVDGPRGGETPRVADSSAAAGAGRAFITTAYSLLSRTLLASLYRPSHGSS